jgi:hypothetical protein
LAFWAADMPYCLTETYWVEGLEVADLYCYRAGGFRRWLVTVFASCDVAAGLWCFKGEPRGEAYSFVFMGLSRGERFDVLCV